MTAVIGVDPPGGWCLLDGAPSVPLMWGVVRETKRKTRGEAICEVLEQCMSSSGGDLWLAIEGQYIPDRADRAGAQRHMAVSTLETAAARGEWVGLAEAIGVRILDRKGTRSTVWRPAVWGRGAGRWGTEQCKAYAVKQAKLVWGYGITPHHAAEAAWIAEYARVQIGRIE